MKRLTWHKPILLLLLISVLLLGSAACTAEAKELAMAWFEDWVEENGTNMIAVGARWLLGTPTGNEDVDAAIDAGRAINDIKEADELMDQGREAQHAGDLDTAAQKMDKAVNKRPNDWTYKISRGVLALLQEDYDSRRKTIISASQQVVQQDLDNGHNLLYEDTPELGTDGPAYRHFLDQNIQEYEQAKQTLESSGFKSDQQAALIYGTLCEYYEQRADLTGSAEDRAKQFEYDKLWMKYGK